MPKKNLKKKNKSDDFAVQYFGDVGKEARIGKWLRRLTLNQQVWVRFPVRASELVATIRWATGSVKPFPLPVGKKPKLHKTMKKKPLQMNKDKQWLLRMAKKENNSPLSVGGLVHEIKQSKKSKGKEKQ